MLKLKRAFGQWVRITHPSTGDVLRIQVDYDAQRRQATLTFDGPADEFRIDRGRDGAEVEAPPITGEALAEAINRLRAARTEAPSPEEARP